MPRPAFSYNHSLVIMASILGVMNSRSLQVSGIKIINSAFSFQKSATIHVVSSSSTLSLRPATMVTWNGSSGSSRPVHKSTFLTSTKNSESNQAENSFLQQSRIDTSVPQVRRKKRTGDKSIKDKRRKFIGQAKAVDRGQWATVYSPGGTDGESFEAKSGLPDRKKEFVVLGIESSCDDTGAAVVRSDGVILGESLASQNEIHEEWGGIVPGLAKTAHEEKIDFVIEEAVRNAGLESVDDVDAIGVTIGPGLEICLRVGTEKAKELALKYSKPFVGIHHLEAHILMARLPFDPEKAFDIDGTNDVHATKRAIKFPFLALLVSGGHCQLLRCVGIGRYDIIGGTLDDSLGEAYDKTARLLGLPIGGGGGPAIETLALEGDPKAVALPIPLQRRKDCDFSYAGLKTAVRVASDKLAKERGLESMDDLCRQDKANIAASFQNVAIKHIEQRLKRTMDMLEKEDEEQEGGGTGTGIRSLAVVGGVAANKELRSRLETVCAERDEAWEMFVPPPRLCTDQGAMSSWAAIERLMVGSSDEAEGQEVYARFPFQDMNANVNTDAAINNK